MLDDFAAASPEEREEEYEGGTPYSPFVAMLQVGWQVAGWQVGWRGAIPLAAFASPSLPLCWLSCANLGAGCQPPKHFLEAS